MKTENKRRASSPSLAPYALTLNLGGCEVEVSDFAPALDGIAPGNLPLILAAALPRPRGLLLDETSLYVLVFPGRPATSGQLLHIDRDSGLMNVVAQRVRPDLLVADRDHVYFSEIERGEVKRLSKHDGEIVTLVAGELVPTCLAVGDAGVFWATPGHEVMAAGDAGAPPRRIALFDGPVTGLAVDDDDLLVALASGELWRVTLDGVARQLFLTGQRFARGFVVDTRRVYWIDAAAHAILSFAKRGGGSVLRLADAPPGEGCLALTPDALVWSDADARNIHFLRRDGAHLVAASSLPAPAEVAAWGEWIAWINRGDGSVMAVRQ